MKHSFRASPSIYESVLLSLLVLGGSPRAHAVESAEGLTVCSDQIGLYQITDVSPPHYDHGAVIDEGTMDLRLVKPLRGHPPATFSRQYFRFQFEPGPRTGDTCYEFIALAKRAEENSHYTAHPELWDVRVAGKDSDPDPELSWRGEIWLERPHGVSTGGVVDFQGKVLITREEIETAVHTGSSLPVVHRDVPQGVFPANTFWLLPVPTSYTDDEKLHIGRKRQEYALIPKQYVLGASGSVQLVAPSKRRLAWALGCTVIWILAYPLCRALKMQVKFWLTGSCALLVLVGVLAVCAARPLSDREVNQQVRDSVQRMWSDHPASRSVRIKDICLSSQGEGEFQGRIIARRPTGMADGYDPAIPLGKPHAVKLEEECDLRVIRHGERIEWKTGSL